MADPSQGAPPAAGLPPGPPPANFFDPKPLGNHDSTIFGVSISLLCFCWLAITARLWTRCLITKNPGWDDLFIVLALLTVTAGTVSFCVATRYGMGEHIYLIPPTDIESFIICHYLDAASYNTSTALIKISLLFQYLRVFERGTYTYRCTQLLLILIAIWGCVFAFMAWFPCLPHPSAMWKMTQKGCYAGADPNMSTATKWIEAHAGTNMSFDIMLLILAFRLLFTKDAQSTMMGMIILLCMGVVSCTFAIWRLVEIIRTKGGMSEDLSWNLSGPTLLSLCEIYIAALCASVPFFWPIITQQLNKIFVSYEFGVSTESRHNDDDHVELARAETWQSGSKSTGGGAVDVKSLESSKAGGGHRYQQQPPHSYISDMIDTRANPFAEDEFRTEAAVQSGTGIGMTGSDDTTKKGGFFRLRNPK